MVRKKKSSSKKRRSRKKKEEDRMKRLLELFEAMSPISENQPPPIVEVKEPELPFEEEYVEPQETSEEQLHEPIDIFEETREEGIEEPVLEEKYEPPSIQPEAPQEQEVFMEPEQRPSRLPRPSIKPKGLVDKIREFLQFPQLFQSEEEEEESETPFYEVKERKYGKMDEIAVFRKTPSRGKIDEPISDIVGVLYRVSGKRIYIFVINENQENYEALWRKLADKGWTMITIDGLPAVEIAKSKLFVIEELAKTIKEFILLSEVYMYEKTSEGYVLKRL